MLTDIFAHRYEQVPIWVEFEAPQRRLLAQLFRVLSEQICPFYVDEKVSARGKAFWTDIHNKLAMELGVDLLSPVVPALSTSALGLPSTYAICKDWMLTSPHRLELPDRFMKERLSLVEIGFRMRGDEIADQNTTLEDEIARTRKLAVPRGMSRASYEDGFRIAQEAVNAHFQETVAELNVRLRQAECPLSYHNGFIQVSTDRLVETQIEMPFWALLTDAKWKNVDTDMKEALHRRDIGGRDPALYAARALESTIKIISDEKGWTQGNETGASRYVDNLVRNGFVERWETEAVKAFFSKVRNPLGHGPGSQPMPSLSPQATDWAIETCMSWIKALIRRM